MNDEEKLEKINKATEQTLTLEDIKEGAAEYEISTEEMLDLMLEDIEQNS